jgi:hypothetical protein
VARQDSTAGNRYVDLYWVVFGGWTRCVAYTNTEGRKK